MRVLVDDLLSTLLGNIVAGTAFAITFGAAQTRFVMIKPSIVHFAFAAAMLWRGWVGRYLPPLVTDHAMQRTKTRQPGARDVVAARHSSAYVQATGRQALA